MQHRHPNPPIVNEKQSTHLLPQILIRYHAIRFEGISITAALTII